MAKAAASEGPRLGTTARRRRGTGRAFLPPSLPGCPRGRTAGQGAPPPAGRAAGRGRGSTATFRSIAERPAEPLSRRLGSGWSPEVVRAEGWQRPGQKEVAVGYGRHGKNL